MYKDKKHVALKRQGGSIRRGIEKIIAGLINDVFKNKHGSFNVAVGGPGGTGKSVFAGRLAGALGRNSNVLKLDDYKTSREIRKKANIYGPHPDANKMDLIARHLGSIKLGKAFRKPLYDTVKGVGENTEIYKPARFNIVDGEVSTYREFREYIDFSIFIDSDWHTQLATRLGRDMEARKYPLEKAVSTFLHSNLREFSAYGSQSKLYCDIHLFCREDYSLEIESVSQDLYGRLKSVLKGNLQNIEISGLILPILTPFNHDGSVDLKSFAAHLDWLSAAGVRRVLVGGTTGEFFSLSAKERLDILKVALEYFPWLVLFNASGSSLEETLWLSKKAQSLGADGILCLPPYFYSKAPEEGVAGYLKAVASNLNIPFIIYNIPRHTQNPATVGMLKSVPHYGLKDSAGDTGFIKHTKRYFTGLDSDIINAYKKGAKGFICGMANVYPELYTDLEKEIESGGYASASRVLKKIIDARKAIRGRDEITALKSMLAGRCLWYPVNVRLPLRNKE